MVRKIRACVFISSNGSNLEALIKHSRDYSFPIKIQLIISNNINAKGLRFAKQYSIPYKFFPSDNKEKFERNSLFEIKKRKIKFLCLAGFMKILSNNFIKTFGYKIVNIHPSLLPKYKGLNVHKQVLDNKEEYTGCTVHYATGELDSGEIIMQSQVKIDKGETIESLERKVLNEEHKLYPKAIRKVLNTIQPRYDYTTKEIIEAMDRINAR